MRAIRRRIDSRGYGNNKLMPTPRVKDIPLFTSGDSINEYYSILIYIGNIRWYLFQFFTDEGDLIFGLIRLISNYQLDTYKVVYVYNL